MEDLKTGLKLQKPQNSDDISVFNPALRANVQKTNDHTHDGTNSPRTAVTTQTIASGGYTDLGNDTHRKLITLASSLQYDDVVIQMKLSTGDLFYPTIEKVSATTFNLFVNDPTQSYTAVYSS